MYKRGWLQYVQGKGAGKRGGEELLALLSLPKLWKTSHQKKVVKVRKETDWKSE